MRDLHTQPTKSLSSSILCENKLRQNYIPAHLEKGIFSPALASQCLFMNPRALSDLPWTIPRFSSAINTGPCSVSPWIGRKTCRIRFHGRKMHCPSEAPVYTPKKKKKKLYPVWLISLEYVTTFTMGIVKIKPEDKTRPWILQSQQGGLTQP